MPTAYAWLDPDQASDGERAQRDLGPSKDPVPGQLPGTLHDRGVYVTVAVPRTATASGGDFSGVYREAFEKLLAEEERVRAGHAYEIGVIW